VSTLEIQTPLGWPIRFGEERWRIISEIKHPSLAGHRQDIIATLSNPDEIRRSKSDGNVYLFYRHYKERRWFCAVIKNVDDSGLLITAYRTDAIKAGEVIWQR
jgi:hypothetical protein